MTQKIDTTMQDPTTRFSKDGCTAFVRIRVDRRDYEFARQWALFHAEGDPEGTAEIQLEGYLAMALLNHQVAMNWEPPEAIERLYRTAMNASKPCTARDRGEKRSP